MLVLRGLSKTFGQLRALTTVSTQIAGGEVLGVIGANGSGKSTLFDVIAGTTFPDSGKVELEGQNLTRLPVEARAPLGIVRAFQVPKPFASLNVRDHLMLAADAGDALRGAAARARVDAVLEKTGLTELADTFGVDLRILDRKRLELAKALATGPKILLLDEVSAGLTEPEVADLVSIISGLRHDDLAILWVEHLVHAIATTCDRVIVLDQGQIIVDGTPAAVMANPKVRALYLGASASVAQC